MKISAVSFVHNEADKIRRALESIHPYVDEIIIYDLESTDGTAEICREFTNNVTIVPHIICGDKYKMDLAYKAKGDWLLWFYGDEIFSEQLMKSLKTLAEKGSWDAFGFMRREYMDDVRCAYNDEHGNRVEFGTPQNQNYQIRFCKKDSGIFYTELVHAELHGKYTICHMPPEYFIEHRKTSRDQEFDNQRLYIWYKYMIWLYGDTKIEPYKTYIDSYKKIIEDSETAMQKGTRRRELIEEEWWRWREIGFNIAKDVKDNILKN